MKYECPVCGHTLESYIIDLPRGTVSSTRFPICYECLKETGFRVMMEIVYEV